MGRSGPGGEKQRELARMATKVIAAGRRGRRGFDWRTLNEKRLNQARTGLFIQNLCETEHAGDYERVGIFILESPKDLGRLYEMAPVRIVLLLRRRRRRRLKIEEKPKRAWVREIFRRRKEQGDHHNLVKELRLHDLHVIYI